MGRNTRTSDGHLVIDMPTGKSVKITLVGTGQLLVNTTLLILDMANTLLTWAGTITATVFKGGLQQTVGAVTADGAITIPSGSKTFHVTKATPAAMTLADPTATTHDGIRLTFISDTAQAHTLSNAAGSGFNGWGATKDVATFGGAIGDLIQIEAYQGKWYIVTSTNITLG